MLKQKSNKIKTVIVSKITPEFTVSVSDINVGADLIVDVFGLPSDAKGLVTVEIHGISNCSDVINGMVTIIVPQRLPNGTYTVTITYSGDDRYNMVKSDENVSVNKLSAEMKVIADNIDVGENLTIQIELPSNITGEFAYISINGTGFLLNQPLTVTSLSIILPDLNKANILLIINKG